jgi:predicted HTH domain antitoxin
VKSTVVESLYDYNHFKDSKKRFKQEWRSDTKIRKYQFKNVSLGNCDNKR